MYGWGSSPANTGAPDNPLLNRGTFSVHQPIPPGRVASTSFHITPGIAVGLVIVLGAMYWWSKHPAFNFVKK